jgi:cytosine deaminase
MDEFMQAAVEEARASLAEGGQPFGSVLVRGDQIIGAGRNRFVQTGDPTSHAEIEAIRAAGAQETYADTVMYATCLPCIMCAGAIVRMKIPKVLVGASPATGNSQAFMRSHGVEVIELELEEAQQLLAEAR